MNSILVIEDNNELMHYLVTVLRSAGNRVIGVSSGKKGLDALRLEDFKFDLLLLDVQLGDGTAFEFLDEVKSESPTFNPKICFVSSRRDAETVQTAVEKGAGDYIVKPILSGTLISKVNKLLGKTVTGEKFSAAPCHFKGELFAVDNIKPDFIVTEVTEMGVKLRTSARLQEGTLIPLIVDELQQILEHDGDHLILRVTKSTKISWGKYQSMCDFVGLGEDKLTRLRAFTIRGSFLSNDLIKNPA